MIYRIERYLRSCQRFKATALLILIASDFFFLTPSSTAKPTPAITSIQHTVNASRPMQAGGDLKSLQPGKLIERAFASGTPHSYRIEMLKDQFLRVVAYQKNVDVAIAAFGPDGKALGEVDSPNEKNGPEMISIIAEVSGTYLLQVRCSEHTVIGGRYEIKIAELRPTTSLDAKLLTAERLLMQAHDLRDAGTIEASTKSIGKYEEVIALYHQAGDQACEASSLYFLGRIYSSLQKWAKSIECYNKALSLAQRVRDLDIEASVLCSMGAAFTALRDKQKVIEYYNQALVIRRTLGDSIGQARIYNDIGWGYRSWDDYPKAIEYYNQALKLSQATGDKITQSSALNNLSLAHTALMEYQKTLDYYIQSLSLKRAIGDEPGLTVLLNNIATLYIRLGEYQKAIDYSKQALPLLRNFPNRRLEAYILTTASYAYMSLGEYDKVLEYLNKALLLMQAIGDQQGIKVALLDLAYAYTGLGQYQKAIDCGNQALAISQRIHSRYGEVAALNALGLAYDNSGDKNKALDYFSQALSLCQLSYNSEHKAIALYRMALIKRDFNNFTEAREKIESALAIVESLRANIVNRELRTSYLASVNQLYEFYVDLLMQLHQECPTEGYDTLALQINERARARSLLDTLAQSYSYIRRGVDAALLERQSALKRLMIINEEKARVGQSEDLNSVAQQLEKINEQIKSQSPHYAALIQPGLVSVQQIQEALDCDTVLLEYALGDRRSYLWIVTASSIASFKLPGRYEIEKLVRRAYQLLTTRTHQNDSNEQGGGRVAESDTEFASLASELSQMLLGPVADKLESKRLLIVPDGALQYLPFAALADPAFASEPIIARHEVVSLPSSSTLTLLRQETIARQLAPKGIAIIADPVFDKDDVRTQAKLKRQRQESIFKPRQTDAETRSPASSQFESDFLQVANKAGFTSNILRFPRLLLTRQEANNITEVAADEQVLKALDFNASSVVATSAELSRYRIVHFATHALLSTSDPELSAIVLSLVDERGSAQNGFLRLSQIYNLNLPAELVVLSACQTALGKQINGEGIVGLTRGFMYAGAKRVVASLWKVNDRATAELMKLFYSAMLKQGQSPGAALRTAQVTLRKHQNWKSPFYWAAFILQGEYK